MLEIWDVEDPSNTANPPLCSVLLKDGRPYFTTVFQNSMYRVLKVNWEQNPPHCGENKCVENNHFALFALIKITSFNKGSLKRRY